MKKLYLEFDSPWKNILDLYFEDFISFFFPQAYKEINWKRGFESLDKEFQKSVRGAKLGSRLADKLFKVWTNQNEVAWVLIHVEIQNQQEATFAERMFVYYYRIYDRYRKKIVSLAILGDESPDWRPMQFNNELWNCRLSFEFLMVKLIDYRQKLSTLESIQNPFAIVVTAHLAAQETRNNPTHRFATKLTITRHLYERGYQKETIINLFCFIDWVMTLPQELDLQFKQELHDYEEKLNMQYVTSIERIGIERGFKKGIEQGIEQMRKPLLHSLKLNLEFKFGKEGRKFLPVISQLKSPKELSTFQDRLKAARTAEELERFYKLV